MNTVRYRIGFELVFRHDFHGVPPQSIADFAVEPLMECRTLLQQYGLRFKATKQSGIVYFSKTGAMDKVPFGERFSFNMRLTEKSFWEKTNPLPISNLRFGKRIRWFSNREQVAIPSGGFRQKLTLGPMAHSADSATFADLELLIPAKTSDPLGPVYQKARIRILLVHGVGPTLAESAPKNGIITLDVRPWGAGTYLLELDRADGGKDEEIVVLYDRNSRPDAPFAVLDVFKESDDLNGNAIDYDMAGLEYVVDFQSKNLPWTYHLIFDDKQVDDSTLLLTCDDPNLSFTKLNASPNGLAGQFRPRKVVTFRSTSAVKATAKPPLRTVLLSYEKFTGTPKQHQQLLPLPALSPETTVFFTI